MIDRDCVPAAFPSIRVFTFNSPFHHFAAYLLGVGSFGYGYSIPDVAIASCVGRIFLLSILTDNTLIPSRTPTALYG